MEGRVRLVGMRPLSVLLFLVMLSQCFADSVRLVSGEVVVGEFVRMTGGKVEFKSESLGTVRFDWSSVAEMTTESAVVVVGKDGEKNNVVVSATREGSFFGSVGWDDVEAINPPAPKVVPVVWSGALSSSLGFTRSNQESQNFDLNLDLTRQGPKDRLATKASYSFARQSTGGGGLETTRDRWTARGQYDYFIADRYYWFGSTRFDSDHTSDLDLRTVLTAGAGYTFFDSSQTSLAADFGFSWVREDYSSSASTDNAALALGMNYRHELASWLTLVQDTEYFPNPEDFGDYFLATELGLRSKLSASMFADFKFMFDFDSTPAPGARKDNYKYFLGIGLRF